MDSMSELSPNSSKCREISLKLCWPHLQEEGTQFYDDNTAFLPSLADGEVSRGPRRSMAGGAPRRGQDGGQNKGVTGDFWGVRNDGAGVCVAARGAAREL